MELVRKNIHMDRIKGQASTQITLEDDINILDSRPDASKLIYDRGSVALEEVKVTEDHVTVKGSCSLWLCIWRRGAADAGMYGGQHSF